MASKSGATSIATSSPAAPSGTLLPEKLSWLQRERPTLPFESNDDFDALLAELIVAYDPKDTIEFILVKELADHMWELLRLRNMRRAAMETELARATHNLLSDHYSAATGELGLAAQRGMTYMVRAAASGDVNNLNSLRDIALDAGVSQRMLQYEAYRIGMKTITALDEAISTSERRRDKTIRMIEDRRRTMGVMSRTLTGENFSRGEDSAVGADAA